MSRTTIKPAKMAFLTIGFHSYILPVEKAIKVAELMQDALLCDDDYRHPMSRYIVRESPDVRFSIIRNGEIFTPDGLPFFNAAPVKRVTPVRGKGEV